MAGLLAEAKRLEERPGMLSVSLFPVQPWLDVPGTGFSVVAVADGPRRAAEVEPAVRQLAWQAWEARRRFEARLVAVDEAIGRALAMDRGPVVLSESDLSHSRKLLDVVYHIDRGQVTRAAA